MRDETATSESGEIIVPLNTPTASDTITEGCTNADAALIGRMAAKLGQLLRQSAHADVPAGSRPRPAVPVGGTAGGVGATAAGGVATTTRLRGASTIDSGEGVEPNGRAHRRRRHERARRHWAAKTCESEGVPVTALGGFARLAALFLWTY